MTRGDPAKEPASGPGTVRPPAPRAMLGADDPEPGVTAVHQPRLDPGQDAAALPLVGLPACIKYGEGTAYHALAAQYLPAVVEASGCLPVPIPALTDEGLVAAYLDRVSGLVLPGSVSNVDPLRYGRPRRPEAEPQDLYRDAATFHMIDLAIERGLPLLAICRGFQELNVARGGTLHAELHNTPGRRDHREPDTQDHDAMYAHSHDVTLAEDSMMARAGFPRRFAVCSLHRQGVDRLGDGLRAEALAEDGTVEMVSLDGARGFVLGVQWHPEYLHARDPHSVRIFRLFGDAARAWAEGRGPLPLVPTPPPAS